MNPFREMALYGAFIHPCSVVGVNNEPSQIDIAAVAGRACYRAFPLVASMSSLGPVCKSRAFGMAELKVWCLIRS